MAPSVSVVIPLYNARTTIGDALRSLRAQTVTDWEAVVVDDGSRDGGHRVVESFAESDDRIRLLRQSNQRQSTARNRGIEETSGRYLLFLDHDDWLRPEALERLIVSAEASTCGAAHGAAAWHGPSGEDLGWTFEPSCPVVGLDELLQHGRFNTSSQVIARETLADLRFRPVHDGVEDHDLWLRLAARGVRWSAIAETVCAYRLHDAGDSRRYDRIARTHHAVLAEAYALVRCDGAALGADASPAREALVQHRTALHYATASAYADPTPGFERAASILVNFGGGRGVDPFDAAGAAHWGLSYAACRGPNVWWSSGLEVLHLSRIAHSWWRRIADMGLAPQGLPALARAELARMACDPGAIAADLAGAVDPSRPLVVLGLGRNASPIVRALAARGITFSARDDALPRSVRVHEVAGLRFPVVHEGEPLPSGTQYLMTLSDDKAFALDPVQESDVVRWSEYVTKRSISVMERLSPFWLKLPPARAVSAEAA